MIYVIHKYHNSRVMDFMSWSMNTQSFVKLSLVEYVFVSLSLAVIIAKFFPATNNFEYQSLYWGSSVVTNVFTYGLWFVAARVGSLYIQYSIFSALFLLPGQLDRKSLYLLSSQECIVYAILFVGALFASLRNHCNKVIPMPTGMGRVLINISFCFSCFCFCVCCSQQCRAITLQVLILFGFMSFIYHIVMDVIILFNEEYRTLYITLTLHSCYFLLCSFLSQYFFSLMVKKCLFINNLSTILQVHLC